MALLSSMISRLAGLSPMITRLSAKLISDPFHYLDGKPVERKLLVYDLPHRKLALANDPAVVEAVLLDKQRTFPKSRVVELLLSPLIGEGVFGQPGGEDVKLARRMFIQALGRVRDDDLSALTLRLARDYLARWSTAGAPVPICSELSRLTIDVASQATMGRRFAPDKSQRFVDLFYQFHTRGSPVQMLLAKDVEAEAVAFVKEAELAPVAHEMRALIHETFVQPLLDGEADALRAPFAAMLVAKGPLPPHDAEHALDQIAVMLLAGHETTASVLSWLLYELAIRPAEQGQALFAIRNGPTDDARAGPWAGAPPAKVIEALTWEALRLYPPIGFFLREATCDVEFREKPIPQGSFMIVSPWTLHHHRSTWREPDAFVPTRWLGPAEMTHRCQFIPFGFGRRVCPGEHFADIEMRVILTELLGRFDVTTTETEAPRPLGGLTTRPDHDIPIVLTPRAD